jgi:pyruvate dehydrogenase (quinone)
MAKKKVADLLVEVLAEAGVRRIYGVSGDSLNAITDSIRSTNNIQWVHLRHEETAATPAPKPDMKSGLKTSNSCIFNETNPKNRTRCPVFRIGDQYERERKA